MKFIQQEDHVLQPDTVMPPEAQLIRESEKWTVSVYQNKTGIFHIMISTWHIFFAMFSYMIDILAEHKRQYKNSIFKNWTSPREWLLRYSNRNAPLGNIWLIVYCHKMCTILQNPNLCLGSFKYTVCCWLT